MTPPTIEFWFEFASTYSYLAAGRIEAVTAGQVEIAWRPFLLGPIFARQGWNDSPFNLYPAKGRYMWRDMERRSARYGLPFRKPTRFPQNGLLAARVACLGQAERWLPDFVRAVYRANFADDRNISSPEVIGAILDGLGQPGALTVERAQAADNKERLRRQNERAAHLGIFGAPSFVGGGELFWGDDRLEDAIDWARTRRLDDPTATAPRRS
jgi:2-hydroxychromene-2-carboxylate isomerase